MDTYSLIEIILGLVSIVTAIIGFSVKSFKSDHDKLKESHGFLALNVSENYAKKEEMGSTRLEMNAAISRVHDKIEKSSEIMDNKMNVIISLLKK